MPDALSDAALVSRIRQGPTARGREDAYRLLVERHWKVLVVLLRARLPSERDAEDLAQEAFVRAFRSLESLESPRLFLGWLIRIAQNLATDHLRRRRSECSLESLGGEWIEACQSPQGSARGVEERLEQEEELERVLEALPRLPDRYRIVLTLRYLKGLSNRELAESLGEPEGTIRNRLFRALEKIRSLLEASRRPGRERAGTVEHGAPRER